MNHSEFAATYPSPFQMAPEFNFDQLELNLKESRESCLQSKKDMEEIERIIHQWNPGIIQSNQQQQQQFYYQSYIQEDCISYSQQFPYFENPNPHSQIDQYQTNLYQSTPPFTSEWSNPSYYYSFTNPYEYSFYPHNCFIQATSCISDWEFQSQASFSTPQSTSMWIPSVPFSFSDRATQIIAILNSTYGSQQQISTIAMTEVVNESSLVRPDLCSTESKLMGGEDTTCLCEVGGNYEINKENYCKNRVDFCDERMGSEVFSVVIDELLLSPQQAEIVNCNPPGVRQNVQEEDHGVNLGETLKTTQCKIHDSLHVSVLCEEKESTVQNSWFSFSMSATKSDIEPIAYDVRGVEKFAEQVEFTRVGDRDLFLGNQLGLVHDLLHYHEFYAVKFDKLLVGEIRTNEPNFAVINLSTSLSMVLSVVPQNEILTSNPKPPWHLFDKNGLNLVIVALSGIEEKETVGVCLVLSSKHQSELADIHMQSRSTRHALCIRDMVRAEGLTMEFYAGVYGNDAHMPYLEWDPGPQYVNILAGIILGNWPSQHRIAKSSPIMRKLALEEIGGESIGKMECCYTPHSECGLELHHQFIDLFGGFALIIEGQYIIMAETIEVTKTKSFEQSVEESHRLDRIEEVDCWIPVYSRSRPNFSANTKEQTLTFDEVFFRKWVQHSTSFLIFDPNDGRTWLLLLMEDEYRYYIFLDGNWGFVGKFICVSRCLTLGDLSFRPLLVEIYGGSGLQLNGVLDRDCICYRHNEAASFVIHVETVYKIIEERNHVVASNSEGDIFYAHQSNFFATKELLMVTLKSKFVVFDRGKIRRQQMAQFNGDSKDVAAHVAYHLHRCFFFNLEDKVASTGEELIQVKWVNNSGVDQAQVELGGNDLKAQEEPMPYSASLCVSRVATSYNMYIKRPTRWRQK